MADKAQIRQGASGRSNSRRAQSVRVGEARSALSNPGERSVEQMLAPLGLGRLEADAYLALLNSPDISVEELAGVLHTPARRVRTALAVLEGHGLASRTARRPVRYLPAPPDAAIEPLIARRHSELEHSREIAVRLGERTRRLAARRNDTQEVVELLTGRDVVARQVQQLEQAATDEILSFDRPPYYDDPEPDNPGEVAALGRGVRVRAVYADQALEVPGRMDHIIAMTELGEQARAFSPLPLKLFIFDRRAALLPARPADPELAAGAVLVHASALLDALHMFFELVWERATPILDGVRHKETPSQPATNAFVSLLAAGLTDDVIARQLALSRRTLHRRMQALLNSLDAHSRFQAGYQLGCRRGETPTPAQRNNVGRRS